MSQIKDFYLNQQERNPHLALQQAEIDAQQDDINAWYLSEDKDQQFQEHCERLLQEKPEFMATLERELF